MRTFEQIKAKVFDEKLVRDPRLEGHDHFAHGREFTLEEMELVINSLEPKIVKRSVKKK